MFNVFKLVAIAPFFKYIIKFAKWVVKDEAEDTEQNAEFEIPELDLRFLDKPALAMEHCTEVAIKMADVAKDTLFDAMNLISEYSEEAYESVSHKEEIVDNYEDKLGTYMLKLSGKELSDVDSQQLSLLLHVIGDFERIADHGINIAKAAKKMDKKQLSFSKKAAEEMAIFSDLIQDIINNII